MRSEKLRTDPDFVLAGAKLALVNAIEDFLESSDESRAAFAKRAGMSRQQLGEILDEESNPTLHTLARLSGAMDRKLSLAFVGHDEFVFTAPRKDLDAVRNALDPRDAEAIPNARPARAAPAAPPAPAPSRTRCRSNLRPPAPESTPPRSRRRGS